MCVYVYGILACLLAISKLTCGSCHGSGRSYRTLTICPTPGLESRRFGTLRLPIPGGRKHVENIYISPVALEV